MTLFLNSHANSINLKKGDVLFHEGERAEAFYIVIKGKIACAKHSEERFVLVAISEEKDIVGGECVFSPSELYAFGAIALEDSEIVKVSGEETRSILAAKSSWIADILGNISEKVENTYKLISEHRIEDARLSGGETLGDEDIALIKKGLSC